MASSPAEHGYAPAVDLPAPPRAPSTWSVGLIGDLVGSRRAASRVELQRELLAALGAADAVVPGLEPLAPTLGDEFQGRYPDLGTALTAVLVLQLHLGAERVRFGLGVGDLLVHDPSATPLRQDGPMWWAARAAVEAVEGGTPRWGARARWWDATVAAATATAGPGVAAAVPWANALAAVRDHQVGRLRARDRRITLAVLAGDTQAVISAREGISPSAVSQRVRIAGARALRDQVAALRTGAAP